MRRKYRPTRMARRLKLDIQRRKEPKNGGRADSGRGANSPFLSGTSSGTEPHVVGLQLKKTERTGKRKGENAAVRVFRKSLNRFIKKKKGLGRLTRNQASR